MKQVPFLDLVKQHTSIKEELMQVFSNALDKAAFVGGPNVTEFEKDFAKFVGSKDAVGVANGTCALRFALLGMGIGKGDKVVTVPNTFIATTEAISQAGAEFDFVDVEEATSLMDMNKLEDCLKKSRAAAVVPVHLYGQCADMDALQSLAQKYEFKILEDAAQAHGATHHGRSAGTMGDAAGFSFYPGKNLGACGEAGAVTTSDPEIASQVRKLREHGQAQKYFHDVEGYNGRIDAIQAGFLRVKLRLLADWNEHRRSIAKIYDQAFAALANVTPAKVLPHNLSCYHLYVVHVPNRAAFQAYLGEHGIATGLHYPLPLHMQKCYENRGWKQGSFPIAEKLGAALVSLPIAAEISLDDARYVAETVKNFRGA